MCETNTTNDNNNNRESLPYPMLPNHIRNLYIYFIFSQDYKGQGDIIILRMTMWFIIQVQ